MSLQEPGPGESFAAHIALVAEAVGENVHGQGGRAHVHLPAHRASLGVLGGQAFVSLLVAGQVGAGGKVFAALCALELVAERILELGPTVLNLNGVGGKGFYFHLWQRHIRECGSWR